MRISCVKPACRHGTRAAMFAIAAVVLILVAILVVSTQVTRPAVQPPRGAVDTTNVTRAWAAHADHYTRQTHILCPAVQPPRSAVYMTNVTRAWAAYADRHTRQTHVLCPGALAFTRVGNAATCVSAGDAIVLRHACLLEADGVHVRVGVYTNVSDALPSPLRRRGGHVNFIRIGNSTDADNAALWREYGVVQEASVDDDRGNVWHTGYDAVFQLVLAALQLAPTHAFDLYDPQPVGGAEQFMSDMYASLFACSVRVRIAETRTRRCYRWLVVGQRRACAWHGQMVPARGGECNAAYEHTRQALVAASHATGGAPAPAPQPPVLVLVDRRLGGNGKHVLNSDWWHNETRAQAEAAGFATEVHYCDSLVETVRVFTSATAIVIVRGACQTNLLACAPGTRVLWIDPCDETPGPQFAPQIPTVHVWTVPVPAHNERCNFVDFTLPEQPYVAVLRAMLAGAPVELAHTNVHQHRAQHLRQP